MDIESSRLMGHGEPDAAEAWVTVEEWGGSSGSALSRTAVLTASASSLTSDRFGSRWGRIGSRVLGAFVPEGFPGSVTPDYVSFQLWDTLQGLSTYIRAMLSTQALLGAIGVGEKSATVIGATFQWFLRDLTGMLGGILFAFYQGSNLDSDAKMWRLVADFMNDLGMLMDLLSPLFPSSLIVIMCLGSLSRSFTGVASGATRAALTQHFALANNAADISAKEGSQETLATMSGMGLGMLLAHVTRGHDFVVWVSFLSLTIFHMFVHSRHSFSRPPLQHLPLHQQSEQQHHSRPAAHSVPLPLTGSSPCSQQLHHAQLKLQLESFFSPSLQQEGPPLSPRPAPRSPGLLACCSTSAHSLCSSTPALPQAHLLHKHAQQPPAPRFSPGRSTSLTSRNLLLARDSSRAPRGPSPRRSPPTPSAAPLPATTRTSFLSPLLHELPAPA